MKRIILALCLAIAAPALAQETPAEIEAKANSIIAALRAQRDRASDEAAALAADVARLTKEIEAMKAAKKEPKK